VPSVIVLEVYRYVLRNEGREKALSVAATMRQGRVIDLDTGLAIEAAELLERVTGSLWSTASSTHRRSVTKLISGLRTQISMGWITSSTDQGGVRSNKRSLLARVTSGSRAAHAEGILDAQQHRRSLLKR